MIPRRYQKAEYKDVPEMIRNKFESMRETRKGLFIHGAVGTGKTHIAYALKNEWDKNNRTAMFYNTTELLDEIRDDFDKTGYDKKFTVERIKESKSLLFLDDIGVEKATDWVLERFYLIVNKRYIDMMPVVFTSNLSIEEIGEVLGDRIASRIVEMCDIVELSGEDKRLKS